MFVHTILTDVIKIESLISLHCFDYGKSFRYTGDVHDFWEMVYVDSGEVGVQSDDREYLLHEGEAIFHKPGEYHNIWANNTCASVIIISFDTESPAISLLEKKKTRFSKVQCEHIAEILCEGTKAYYGPFDIIDQCQLIRRPDAPFGVEQMIRTHFEQLLIDIIRNGSEGDRYQGDFEAHPRCCGHDYLVSDILSILDSNICGHISLESMSKRLNFSVSHIKTVFKKETGNSIYHTFMGKKLTYSKKLLSDGSHSITEISEMLGFNSVHHYSRAFKESTGMTPTDYTNSVRKRALL